MAKTREIICADCETNPFNGTINIKPFIWGCYSPQSGFLHFDKTEEFIQYIYKRNALVYFHNGGKFDFHFMLDYITPFDDNVLIINGRLSKFYIGNSEFRDSFLLFPMPLAGYKKEKFDYNLCRPELRDIPENREKILDYLESDCVYLYDLVADFIETYGHNITLAATALKTWTKMSGIKKPKTSERFFDTFTRFYFGGRVECFEKGILDYPLKAVDINSAYPAAMLDFHPWGDDYIVSDKLPSNEEDIKRSFIILDCVSNGALPYREKGKGLSFPADGIKRQYFATGHEYLAGVELGLITDITIRCVYSFIAKIEFRDYVTHFTEMKVHAKNEIEKRGKKGDLVRKYLFAKLMQNALYGKYATNPKRFRKNMFIPKKLIAGAMEFEGFLFKDFVGENMALMESELTENEDGSLNYEGDFLNVATAASITGHVRAFLLRSLHAVEHPIYCDTDSIVCVDYKGLDMHPSRLGAWDLEGEFETGGVAGKKLYCFKYSGEWKKKNPKLKDDYKIACKGVRLTPDQILKVCGGAEVKAKNEAPTFSLSRGVVMTSRTIKMT